MIHGSADNYIKPEMGQELFAMAGNPKEFWLVDGAKHNQAINDAGDEYKRRVRAFFDEHLANPTATDVPVVPPAPAPPHLKEHENPAPSQRQLT